jgi:hypothetical protein
MPWVPANAKKHTHKAKSTAAKKQWSATANSVLASGKSEGAAVRIANAAVKKRKSK